MLKDATALVGVGQTEFGKKLQPSELELACTAILNALDDAGIDRSEVDGLASYTQEANSEVEVARNLGLGDITWFGQVGYGGGAGPGVLGNLALAVAAGQCRVGVAWRSRKRASGAVRRPWSQQGSSLMENVAVNYTRPFGVIRPVDEIALLARRYMHEYGATRDHLANVAIAQRKYANNNPDAMMHDKPMTREDYMAARWISKPLCLFDNCLETDGALAAIVVAADRAKDCPHPPVYIHAFGQGFHAQHQVMQNFFCEDPLRGPAWVTAKQLFSQSDIQPPDIDVAQIYDAFTALIPLSLEGYGFCERGEGGAFTDNGNLELTGDLPCNTSGGGLSEAYVHGFNLITEGVRQLRGTSHNQVDNAQTCLVTGGEGVPNGALILRR
ncbi:MAG: lipid-transfer protein [Pseudomonadota bacterium]